MGTLFFLGVRNFYSIIIAPYVYTYYAVAPTTGEIIHEV